MVPREALPPPRPDLGRGRFLASALGFTGLSELPAYHLYYWFPNALSISSPVDYFEKTLICPLKPSASWVTFWETLWYLTCNLKYATFADTPLSLSSYIPDVGFFFFLEECPCVYIVYVFVWKLPDTIMIFFLKIQGVNAHFKVQ